MLLRLESVMIILPHISQTKILKKDLVQDETSEIETLGLRVFVMIRLLP